MLSPLIALTGLLSLAPLAFATPVDADISPHGSDWTWKNLHDHAVSQGGENDLIALAVTDFITKSNGSINWDQVYDGSLLSSDGTGTLVVANTPHGRAMNKRVAGLAMTGYPWTSNCQGEVAYRWTNMAVDSCFSSHPGGGSAAQRLYSFRLDNPGNRYGFWTWRDDPTCTNRNDAVTGWGRPSGCQYTLDGRGDMGFQWRL